MSKIVLIIGKSGSGKSFSLKNLEKETSAIICPMPKGLPFRNDLDRIVTPDHAKISRSLKKAAEAGRKLIVIDDFQYVMVKEFMDRVNEKGFQKFNDIAAHAYEIVTTASSLADDVVVYFLCHSEEDDLTGRQRMKTIGKLLDNTVDLQGMFDVVLLAKNKDGEHYFKTESDGDEVDSVKAPQDMFQESKVSNNINYINKTILGYYNEEK